MGGLCGGSNSGGVRVARCFFAADFVLGGVRRQTLQPINDPFSEARSHYGQRERSGRFAMELVVLTANQNKHLFVHMAI